MKKHPPVWRVFHYEISGSGFFIQCSFQSTGQLIAAGGILESAGVAGEQFNYAGCFHSLDQLGDGLQIAVASAGELYIFYDSVLQIQGDLRGAGSFCFVGMIHFIFLSWIVYSVIVSEILAFPADMAILPGWAPAVDSAV